MHEARWQTYRKLQSDILSHTDNKSKSAARILPIEPAGQSRKTIALPVVPRYIVRSGRCHGGGERGSNSRDFSVADTSYEVIVVGGGAAGVCAAIQAARAGARTLLVEKNGMLGGTTTVAGVNFPGLFHAWGKQVIAGIGWDLVMAAIRDGGGQLPDFTRIPERHWQHQVMINPAIYAALCDEAVVAAGVDLWLHTMPAQVARTADGGWRLTLCGKGGLETQHARILVDATADANLVALAGGPLQQDDERQPATLVYLVTGYNYEELDLEAINAAVQAEVAAGRLHNTDFSWQTRQAHIGGWLRTRGKSSNHLHHYDARTSQGKTQLELGGRAALLRLIRFLRRQPGLDKLTVAWISPECGVRDTVRIRGRVTITGNDFVSGRRWPDALCQAFYPIDIHSSKRADGLDMRPLAPGVVPTVPRRALLPEGLDGLVVAGRCLSADQEAHSALRVQATAMATGQAAGAMAALAARGGLADLEQLPLTEIHALLASHGAIIPTATQ